MSPIQALGPALKGLEFTVSWLSNILQKATKLHLKDQWDLAKAIYLYEANMSRQDGIKTAMGDLMWFSIIFFASFLSIQKAWLNNILFFSCWFIWYKVW